MNFVPGMINAFIDRSIRETQLKSDLATHGLVLTLYTDEAEISGHGPVTQIFIATPAGDEDAWIQKLPTLFPYYKEIERQRIADAYDW